jgi:hypothetical protein
MMASIVLGIPAGTGKLAMRMYSGSPPRAITTLFRPGEAESVCPSY